MDGWPVRVWFYLFFITVLVGAAIGAVGGKERHSALGAVIVVGVTLWLLLIATPPGP